MQNTKTWIQPKMKDMERILVETVSVALITGVE